MNILGLLGIVVKKMETTMMGFRGLGVWVQGSRLRF